MPTFSELIADVEDNTLHVTAETSLRIPGWIQQAQRRLEERYSWPSMRVLWSGDTLNPTGTTTDGISTLTNAVKISDSFGTFLGDLLRFHHEKPYFLDGVTGNHVRMDWLETTGQEENDLSSLQFDSTGAPKFLSIQRDGIVAGSEVVEVWPTPDQSNTIGTFSASGDFLIRFWSYRRLQTLVVGTVDTNWFTDNCYDFMEHWATFKALSYNDDNDKANTHLALSKQAMMVHLRTQRKADVGVGLSFRPRSGAGYRASRFSGR